VALVVVLNHCFRTIFAPREIMLERNDVTEGTVGQHVEIYDFADGRMEVLWKGISLPYVTFDKDQRVSHTAIVENKRLGAALTFIKAQRDLESSPPRVKTNSEAGRYRKNGRKPGRRSHLVPREVVAVDPSVPLADAPARLALALIRQRQLLPHVALLAMAEDVAKATC
jgi:hypothetical protein